MVSRDGAYRLEIKNGSSSRQSILDTFSDSVGTARDGSPLFAYVAGEDGRSLSTTASSPGGWWSNCILSSEAFGPDLPQNRLIEPHEGLVSRGTLDDVLTGIEPAGSKPGEWIRGKHIRLAVRVWVGRPELEFVELLQTDDVYMK